MNNRNIVEQATTVGCYHCCKIFPTTDIKEYTDKAKTCICPHCNVDAIIGEMSGVELTEDILKKANNYWFVKDQSKSS